MDGSVLYQDYTDYLFSMERGKSIFQYVHLCGHNRR